MPEQQIVLPLTILKKPSFRCSNSVSYTSFPVHHDRIITLQIVEVAVHTILFVRRLYPVDLFTRKKKWDAPVYQSRHPALNEYISGAVKAVGEELSRVILQRSCLDKI